MKKRITKHYVLPEIVVRGKKPQRYIMKPEDQLDFIGALTGGLFSFFSPTQVTRKVYDVSKSIKNKEGIDKIGRSLFQTNSGIVTKKFEREHPVGAAITNLIGDVAIPAGLFGTAKGINYLARMDMPRFGHTPTTKYQFAPGYAGMGGGPIKESLPEALVKKGWKLSDDGARISPEGQRFVKNSEGKWQSENSIAESQKAAAQHKKNIVDPQISKQKQQKDLQKAIKEFEDAGIFGFRTQEWQSFRKGFKTTDADVKEYESHVPEYLKIFKNLRRKGLLSDSKGHWEGNVNGEMVPVNARQYIIANHKNFTDNGWIFDSLNRGTAMFPKTALEIQENGGLSAANWATNSKDQLGVFSHQRNDGPVLRGLVSTKSKPDRIVPVRYAHEANTESYKGLTEFEGPVGLSDNDNIKGLWRVYGPDMQVKAIDGNTGLFDKAIKNPLSGIIPPVILGYITNNN